MQYMRKQTNSLSTSMAEPHHQLEMDIGVAVSTNRLQDQTSLLSGSIIAIALWKTPVNRKS